VVRKADRVRREERMALAELVSRVVERGVVLSGDLVVSVGGVDLLYVGLDVLLTTMDQVEGGGTPSDEDREEPGGKE
jgi:gas vesicle structural protein